MKRPCVGERTERRAVAEYPDNAKFRIEFLALTSQRIDTHREHVADPNFRVGNQLPGAVVQEIDLELPVIRKTSFGRVKYSTIHLSPLYHVSVHRSTPVLRKPTYFV